MNRTLVQALLPEGFYDLLVDQVEREQALEQTLLSLLASFGYRRIAPSLVEYEDSLLAHGEQQQQREHCFRVVDSTTQRMMAIRCDMTMQVARLAATRLRSTARPLRLSYAGLSLRTRASAAKPHRQFSQLGCEQFGKETPSAYGEILTLAAHALTLCDIEQPTIEIAAPTVVRQIAEAHNLDAQQRALLATSFAERNKESLNKLADKTLAEACRSLLALRGEVQATLRALKQLSAQQPALGVLAPLWLLLEQIVDAADLPDDAVSITLDPVETRGFFYHESFAFTLLCKGARGALGRGGAYRSPWDSEPACGCSFYLDALADVILSPPLPLRCRIYAAHDAARDAVRRRRKQGDIIVQALQEESAEETLRAAKNNGCSRVLHGETLETLS